MLDVVEGRSQGGLYTRYGLNPSSRGTRNSFIVQPIALAASHGRETVVVLEWLVEMFVMSFFLWGQVGLERTGVSGAPLLRHEAVEQGA